MMPGDDERVFNLSRGMVSMDPALLIKMLWAVIILGSGATVTAAKFAWDANNELRDMKQAIADVGRMVENRTNDRWTLSMQRKWGDDLGRTNPMIAVPDTDSIHSKLSPR